MAPSGWSSTSRAASTSRPSPQLTRQLSRQLDDDDPVAGHYTLEISTPGLERRLRTPEHFARSVGDTVQVKTRPEVEGERRLTGVLAAADADGIVVRPTARATRPSPSGACATTRSRPLAPCSNGATPRSPGRGSKPGSVARPEVDEAEEEGGATMTKRQRTDCRGDRVAVVAGGGPATPNAVQVTGPIVMVHP